MNTNGHITLESIRSIIDSAIDGVVDFEGRVDIDDVVNLLEGELGKGIIQQILTITGKENLVEVITMFV